MIKFKNGMMGFGYHPYSYRERHMCIYGANMRFFTKLKIYIHKKLKNHVYLF